MSHHTVSCPQCKKPAALSNNQFRPFCSERCQLIDLGSWANEDYKISQASANNQTAPTQEKPSDDSFYLF